MSNFPDTTKRFQLFCSGNLVDGFDTLEEAREHIQQNANEMCPPDAYWIEDSDAPPDTPRDESTTKLPYHAPELRELVGDELEQAKAKIEGGE